MDADLSGVKDFIKKLWLTVNDSEQDKRVKWNSNGTGLIFSEALFAVEVLHKESFESYHRNLNIYGFSKLNGEYSNPKFYRAHPELLKEIERNVTGPSKKKRKRTDDTDSMLSTGAAATSLDEILQDEREVPADNQADSGVSSQAMDFGNHELHAIAQEPTKLDQENVSAASSSGKFYTVTALCPQDLERLCLDPSELDQLRALLSAGMQIDPIRASLQGGGNFHVQFEKKLPDFVESAHAIFSKRPDGLVMVHKTTQGFNMHGERIPPGEKVGEVIVQVITLIDSVLVLLGTATFEYYDPEEEMLTAVLKNMSLCGKLFMEIGKLCQESGENDTSNSLQTLGLGGGKQQSDTLRKLTFTAAGIGDEEFIRLVFSTSAGHILFEAYKNDSPLPEEIAEANGHDKIAAFLRGITERFSKEGGTNRTQTKDINWFELARAVEEREAPSVSRPEIIARGSIAKTAYNKALMEGKTVIKRTPIMLIGQDRVGKTSLKKSLIEKPFNLEEDSTSGIDVVSTHFIVSNEIFKTRESDQAKKAMTLDTPSSETSRDATEPIQTHEDLESDNSQYVPDASDEENLDAAQKITDERNFIENLIHEVDKVKEEEIYSVVWDFGGKSVYSAIHPLFLSPRAVYLLVWNLSWNLHDKAIPDPRKGMFNASEDSFGAKTNLDILDYWMTSVASLANQAEDHQVQPGPECEVLPVRPPVFLVCTHADQPHGGADPRVLAREVFNSLQYKPYKKHLYDDVFVVDNTKSGMECECSEITRLREKVLTVAKGLPQINEFVPIKWLKYENILQVTKGYKWISLKKAKQIAFEECKIEDDQEFLSLLKFLHDQRVMVHFDDSPELNKLIVLDPLWLIDVFKKVITVRPYDHEERELKELWRKLVTTGIVEETLLKHVWDPLLVEQEIFQSLIAIMEKCSLLHPWPSSDASCSKQYLVPSMLMSHPPQNMIGMAASAHFPPLFLTLEPNHVLPGLFYNFVSQFFHWIKGVWKTVIPQLYCNFARFCKSSDEGCSVMLVCHPSSVEVVFHEGDLFLEFEKFKVMLPADLHTFEVNCACSLRRQLGLMLECSRKTFCWLKNIRCEVGVICPVCCQGGAVNYCRTHRIQACMKEECLHFWSETVLRSANQFICTRSAAAPYTPYEVEQFAPWIVFLDEQQGVEPDGGYLPSEEEDETRYGSGQMFSWGLPMDECSGGKADESSSNSVQLPIKDAQDIIQGKVNQVDTGTVAEDAVPLDVNDVNPGRLDLDREWKLCQVPAAAAEGSKRYDSGYSSSDYEGSVPEKMAFGNSETCSNPEDVPEGNRCKESCQPDQQLNQHGTLQEPEIVPNCGPLEEETMEEENVGRVPFNTSTEVECSRQNSAPPTRTHMHVPRRAVRGTFLPEMAVKNCSLNEQEITRLVTEVSLEDKNDQMDFIVTAQRALAVVYEDAYPCSNRVRQGLEEILNQIYGGSQHEFTSEFITPTILLLKRLKAKGFPLVKEGKVIVHLLSPSTCLESGEMFYQVRHTTPGTLALKFTKYLGNLVVMQPAAIKEQELHLAFTQQFIEKMQRVATRLGDQLMRVLLTSKENGQGVYVIDKIEVKKIMPDSSGDCTGSACHAPVMERSMPKCFEASDSQHFPATGNWSDQAIGSQTGRKPGRQPPEHSFWTSANNPPLLVQLKETHKNQPLVTKLTIMLGDDPSAATGHHSPHPNPVYPPLGQAVQDDPMTSATGDKSQEHSSTGDRSNPAYPSLVQAVQDDATTTATGDKSQEHSSTGHRSNPAYPSLMKAVKDDPTISATVYQTEDRSHSGRGTNPAYPPLLQAFQDDPTTSASGDKSQEHSSTGHRSNPAYPPLVQAVQDDPTTTATGDKSHEHSSTGHRSNPAFISFSYESS